MISGAFFRTFIGAVFLFGFIPFWVEMGIEIESEYSRLFRNSGKDEEEKALYDEESNPDSKVVEPLGRTGWLGHDAGGFVSFPPNYDADDEGGDGKKNSKNGMP